MHITFGLSLDGSAHPSVLSGRKAVIGEAILGPTKLLELLETHCGLLGRYAGESIRIATYAERLVAGDSPTRFFHRSLARDRWGTARTLLHWRDGLIEAGWSARKCGQPRLDDLASIEAVSSPVLPPGRAERIQSVIKALSTTSHPIKTITHAEPFTLLPKTWQRILTACNVPLSAIPTPLPIEGTSDLSQLQRVLIDPTYTPTTPKSDATVLRLCAPDPWQAGEALASSLISYRDLPDTFVMVRGGAEQILDQTLGRHGLPATGFTSPSRWRPALQVLPLVFACAWKPLDPYRLLELLMLPISPLPQRAAHILARAFRERPGIGNFHWKAAWQEAIYSAAPARETPTDDADLAAELALQAADSGRDPDRPYSPTRMQRRFERWLGPEAIARFDPNEGIPQQQASIIASNVAQWAEGRIRLARDASEPGLRMAARQAYELRAILSLWQTSENIPRTQMDQMLDQVMASSSTAVTIPAEAGHIPTVDSPAAILQDTDVVIWWNFVDVPTSRRLPPPWSDGERAALNLPLDDARASAATQGWQWRQPLLRARKALILVEPANAHHHPLYDELRARFCPSRADEARITVDIPTLLAHARRTRRFALIRMDPPSAAWHIQPGRISPPSRESASSIESLLACPLQWVLRYAMNLREGTLGAPSADKRLRGHLAHEVIEELLTPGPIEMDPQEAANRAAMIFDRRIAEQATPFLMADRMPERLALKHEISRAAAELIRELTKRRLQVIGTEVQCEKPLETAVLAGRFDVLLTRPSTGAPFVVDLKYGKARYFQPLMVQQKSVQLATYARLARLPDGPLPDVAYYSISDTKLLTQDGASAAATWERVMQHRADRIEEIRSGTISVTGVPNREPDALALGLEPPCSFCDFKMICRASSHAD